MRFVLACTAVALLAPSLAPPPAGQDIAAIERGTFDAVNQQRRNNGLPALKWNDQVAAEARRHSRGMAERWFFSHADPVRGDLAARLNEDKIPWRRCAENIFSESGYSDPVKQAVDDWMRSPGHRRNILDKAVTETGVGVWQRGGGELFITQEFVRPPEQPPTHPLRQQRSRLYRR